jgi:hypothetical protein
MICTIGTSIGQYWVVFNFLPPFFILFLKIYDDRFWSDRLFCMSDSTVSGLRQKDPELSGIVGKAPGLLGRPRGC